MGDLGHMGVLSAVGSCYQVLLLGLLAFGRHVRVRI